jgi:tRNA(fMet)-specific endonuclease VapC
MRCDVAPHDGSEDHQRRDGGRAGAIKAEWGERARNELEATIKAYVAVNVDDEIANIWARLQAECLKHGRGAGLNDLWIAATALRLDCPVAALDNDFTRIPGIQLLGPSGEVITTT